MPDAITSTLAALFTSYTQNTRLLRLSTPLGSDTLLAESVHGEEGLSSGFSFTITALSLDAHLSLRSLLGQAVLLELLTSDNSCRPFHGHVTTVEQSGANGGLARYTLTLAPWTAFLAHNRDSRVFQQKTVCDILDAVFAGWQGQGRLTPSWRYELAQAGSYPQRSITTQYQESDWAFAERLMSETGLFYYFEHSGDARSPSLGRHQLVIADHNGAFQPNRQASVRFTQSGAVMREDSLDRWRCDTRQLTNAIALSSWDYRAYGSRQAAASLYPATPEMQSRDAPGQYAWPDQEQGQRTAARQLDALGTRRLTFTGAGSVRTCAPGTTFALAGHPVHDATFLVTRVVHAMRNNLHADLAAKAADCLVPLAAAPIYRNRIEAIPATVRYQASRSDGHGRLLHPHPTVRGQQTAIVVGPGDAVVHTDRDHRVKVQFASQRGQSSQSRLALPALRRYRPPRGGGRCLQRARPQQPAKQQVGGRRDLRQFSPRVLILLVVTREELTVIKKPSISGLAIDRDLKRLIWCL